MKSKKNALLAYIFPLFLSIVFVLNGKQTNAQENDPWDKLDEILKNIVPPTFPNRDFDITNYGAVNDGKTYNTDAFQQAILACNKAGGGRVVVPEGNYFTGPIHLKSNVNLHLKKGATILFSTEPKDYLPLVHTKWEGVELMNYSPLVYAFEQENIAITGEGILDGQADQTNWWPWKGLRMRGSTSGERPPNQNDKGNRPALFEMGENNIPVPERIFGEGHYLRPQFVQPYRCKNILIEGVKIINSPMWILHPAHSENITIKNVSVNSHGPNNDGCDPESCKNILIKDCNFNTGDDCIAIKSGRNGDGRRLNIPCENIVIQGCTMADGHGGVVIGSEITGGVRNVFAEDCVMDSPHLQRALRIKTSSMRGGTTENVYLRNIKIGQISDQLVRINMFYEDSGPFMPSVRNVEMKNVSAKSVGRVGVLLEGQEESPIENIRLVNVTIDETKVAYKFSNAKNIVFENVNINGEVVRLEKN